MGRVIYFWWERPRSELRAGDLPQASPAPPLSTDLKILVGAEPVFQGNVTPILQAWARYCALSVAHLWECPANVLRYLETGEGDPPLFLSVGYGQQNPAGHAVRAWTCARDSSLAGWAPESAYGHALHAIASDSRTTPDSPDLNPFRHSLTLHLRSLLLQPLLPPTHQDLLHPSHEPVLIDYLLETRHRVASK